MKIRIKGTGEEFDRPCFDNGTEYSRQFDEQIQDWDCFGEHYTNEDNIFIVTTDDKRDIEYLDGIYNTIEKIVDMDNGYYDENMPSEEKIEDKRNAIWEVFHSKY